MRGFHFKDLFQYSFWGNNPGNILWFVGIIVLGLLIKRFISILISRFAYRFVKKASGGAPIIQFIRLLRKPFELLVTLIFIYIASRFISLPDFMRASTGAGRLSVQEMLAALYKLLLIASIAWILLRTVDFLGLAAMQMDEKEGDNGNHRGKRLVPFLKELMKVTLVLLTVSIVLSSVFHVNVSALVAGLGIGGLAIALAARDTLENLLSSFTIFLDKPFKVGDVVKTDAISGTVERVGFRSTRVRTGDKTRVTVPNKMMVDRPMENITLRLARKVNLTLRLSLSTTPAQIKAVLEELRFYVNSHPISTKDEEINFFDFGNDSFLIQVGYALNVEPYSEYLAIREEVNFKILEILKKQGVYLTNPFPAINVKPDNDKAT